LVLVVKLAISGDERARSTDNKGDLVIGITPADENNNTRKGCDVVLYGSEGMIQMAGDLVGLETLDLKAYGLNPMGLTRSDIVLLATGGDVQLVAADSLDIANYGTDPTVKQPKRQILVAEQLALFPSFPSDAQDTRAAQTLDSMSEAELKILLSGVKGEPDGDLLTLLQRFTGRLARGDNQEQDLTEAELPVVNLGFDGKDLFESLQNCLGDEGRAIGPLLDATSKHAVESLCFEMSLT
jgi:hypothetical protein